MWVTKHSVDIAQFYETKHTNYGAKVNARWNQMVSTPNEFKRLAKLGVRW